MAKKPEKITPKPAKAKPAEDEELDEKDEEGETPTRISSNEEKEVEKPVGDYLLPYQYKMVNNKPLVGGVLTNPDKGSKAEIMKASLLKQRRVSVMIPLDPGSSPKVPYSVCLNGYRLDYPVQQYIDMPEQVADKIRKANNQTIAALNRDRIDGDESKENALS